MAKIVIWLALAACGAAGKKVEGPVGGGAGPARTLVSGGVWLWIEPLQAGNAWDGVQAGDTESVGYPIDELENVDAYFEGRGIELMGVGLMWSAQPIKVCQALSCPRGDRLVVVAKAEDAKRMQDEMGFRAVEPGVIEAMAPSACGEAWGQGEKGEPVSEEARRVVQWAGDAGSVPRWVGFVYVTTKRGEGATACGAPRSELVVIEAGAPGVLEGKGFVGVR